MALESGGGGRSPSPAPAPHRAGPSPAAGAPGRSRARWAPGGRQVAQRRRRGAGGGGGARGAGAAGPRETLGRARGSRSPAPGSQRCGGWTARGPRSRRPPGAACALCSRAGGRSERPERARAWPRRPPRAPRPRRAPEPGAAREDSARIAPKLRRRGPSSKEKPLQKPGRESVIAPRPRDLRTVSVPRAPPLLSPDFSRGWRPGGPPAVAPRARAAPGTPSPLCKVGAHGGVRPAYSASTHLGRMPPLQMSRELDLPGGVVKLKVGLRSGGLQATLGCLGFLTKALDRVRESCGGSDDHPGRDGGAGGLAGEEGQCSPLPFPSCLGPWSSH